MDSADTFEDGWTDEAYMLRALAEAAQAEREGEVPVGAIIVHQGEIIASAHNQREQLRDPTAHAEMIAITQAAEALGSWRLIECTLYVTLEPCVMCSGAILQARIPDLVFGTLDPKGGGAMSVFSLLNDSRLNHQTSFRHGICRDESAQFLSRFFAAQRRMGKK